MGHVTRALLLLAVVVPVTAYVVGSLTSPGAPPPADHSPVILRDPPADEPGTPGPAAPDPTSGSDRGRQADGDGDRDGDRRLDRSGGGEEARVVTPRPTPVGEDDDDQWDDDGPDDDDTDDERTDGDD
jgi:hypothetical protein